MVTALEAVSADGYVFPSFLISKGQTHTYGRFGNVTAADSEVRFAKSPKGWIDEELACHWLAHVYHPFSLKRIQTGETRLLILDGHSSHINARFLKFCEENDIVCFCLPAHSTHLLQPLDVGLFGPFQHYYGKAVEDFFLSTNLGITHSSFLPLYKKACAQAFTRANIESAFRACGIVPFNARVVTLPKNRSTASDISLAASEIDREFTQVELRQQGIWRLEFVKTATPGEVCDLVHKFNSREVYLSTKVQILEHELVRQKKELAQAQTKKDRRVLSKARVLTGREALDSMEAADAKKASKTKGRRPRKVVMTPSRPSSKGTVTAASAVSVPVSVGSAVSAGLVSAASVVSAVPVTPRRSQRLVSRPSRVRFRTPEPSPLSYMSKSPPSCIVVDDEWSSDDSSVTLEDLAAKMHGMQLRSRRN